MRTDKVRKGFVDTAASGEGVLVSPDHGLSRWGLALSSACGCNKASISRGSFTMRVIVLEQMREGMWQLPANAPFVRVA